MQDHDTHQYSLLESQSVFHAPKVTVTSKIISKVRAMKKGFAWCLVMALIAVAMYYFNLSWIYFPVMCFTAFLASGGPSFPRVFFRTFLRDFSAIYIFIKIQLKAKYYESKKYNVSDLIKATVTKYPDKTALHFEGKNWTFKEIDEYTNRVANFFKSRGFEKGNVVALFMENRPEYIIIWLGLAKIGVISALINFNLRQDSLIHCITVCKARALIFSSDFSDSVVDICEKLDDRMEFYSYGNNSNGKVQSISLEKHLKDASSNEPTINYNKSFGDILIYIYTSGTTGLPKPAIIRTSRFFLSSIFGALFNVTSKDTVYCTLPLYHSAGGLICAAYCFFFGATVVIRRKFSASRFWDDCIEHKVTVIQYIGELARYLLAQPPRPSDTQHTVRLAVGNGLRPKIWPDFQSRFNLKQIAEFYAATEGNVGLVNTNNTVGSCGFMSRILPRLLPNKLVRIDSDTGDIIRGADGLAIDCRPGESGMLVGKVLNDSSAFRFDGYLNQNDTAKKIARNVFAKNDMAFLTGDVVIYDEYGNVFFQDRTGDTFRWRGENVSTAEVESIISKVVGLRDVVVYGVEVPGAEGKAGMVTIADPENRLDVECLARKFELMLPSYACPVFLRIAKAVDMTATFKFQKTKLKQEGFDINAVKLDRLYYLHSKSKCYLSIDSNVYSQIVDGNIRL